MLEYHAAGLAPKARLKTKPSETKLNASIQNGTRSGLPDREIIASQRFALKRRRLKREALLTQADHPSACISDLLGCGPADRHVRPAGIEDQKLAVARRECGRNAIVPICVCVDHDLAFPHVHDETSVLRRTTLPRREAETRQIFMIRQTRPRRKRLICLTFWRKLSGQMAHRRSITAEFSLGFFPTTLPPVAAIVEKSSSILTERKAT